MLMNCVFRSIVQCSMSQFDIPGIPDIYLDESRNKVWICPACGEQDNGSPMIGCDAGCDKCDDW